MSTRLAAVWILALTICAQFTFCQSSGLSPATATTVTGTGLTPIDSGQLPVARDNSPFPPTGSYYEGFFMDVEVVGNHAFVTTNEGFQIWDVSAPASPARLCYKQMKNNDFPKKPADPHNAYPISALSVSASGNAAVLCGSQDVGVIIVDTQNKSNPRVAYQDTEKGIYNAYCVTVNGREYAFPVQRQISSSGTDPNPGAMRVYDLTAAIALPTTSSGEKLSFDGVYVHRFGQNTWYYDVHGCDNFLVASTAEWGAKGLEFWDISNPLSPVAKHGSTRPLPGVRCLGVKMWKSGTQYLCAVITNRTGNVHQLEIYDASAILAGAQTQFGTALYAAVYPLTVAGIQPLCFSRSQNGTPFLYMATGGTGTFLAGQPQSEWLLNVSNPSTPLQVGSASYWTHYYQFQWVMPRQGAFKGDYFYRASCGVLDAHQWNGGGSTISNEVTITAVDGAASEPSGNVGMYRISFTPPLTSTTTVNFNLSGSASPGGMYQDYSLSATQGTIGATSLVGIPTGTASIDVVLVVMDDINYEGNETAVFTLISATQGYTIGTPNSATVTIADNEAPPTTSVTVAAGDATAAEPGTDTGTFVVTFTPATAAVTDIGFALSGTAVLGAGQDYTLVASAGTIGAGGVTGIPAGTGTLTITLTPIDDSSFEGSEGATLTLTSATGGYGVGAQNSAMISINDDDAPPSNSLSLAVTDAAAAEPGNTGMWTLTFNPATAGASSIAFTLSGSATEGVDYTLVAGAGTVAGGGIVGIPAGTSTLTLVLVPMGDGMAEGTENVTLTLTSVSAPYALAGSPGGTISLHDDPGTGGAGIIGGGGGGGGCSAGGATLGFLPLLSILLVVRRRRNRS